MSASSMKKIKKSIENLNFLNIHNPFKSTPEALTFVEEAMKYQNKAIEQYIGVLREINYEVSNRKQRIDSVEKELKKLTEEEIK